MAFELDLLDNEDLIAYNESMKKNHKHLYLCRSCVRSMGSPEHLEECKFCGSKVEKIKAPRKYHYFCVACDYRFKTIKKHSTCPRCERYVLHMLKWEELKPKEKRKIWIARALKKLHVKTNGLSHRKKKKTKKMFSILSNGHSDEELPSS